MSIPPESAARMVKAARQHNRAQRSQRIAEMELAWHDQDRGPGCAVALIPLSFAVYLVSWAVARFLF